MLTPIQREHLDLIRTQTGGVLRPREVLNDARNPNSPLHDLFLWNDTEAAEAYRLIQAKQVIKVVVKITAAPRQEPQRVVVRTAPQKSEPQPEKSKHTLDEEAYIRATINHSKAHVQADISHNEIDYWSGNGLAPGPPFAHPGVATPSGSESLWLGSRSDARVATQYWNGMIAPSSPRL